MFDLHVQAVLQNGFKYFRADRSLFDPIFGTVSDNFKARMFTKLNNVTINFDNAYNVKTAKDLPLVTIELNETNYDSQGLGQAAYSVYTPQVTGGRLEDRFIHEFTSQLVSINLYAADMELLRVMHQVTRASMLLFSRKILEAGFENLIYNGTNSLLPNKDLQIADLVVYGRQSVYSALQIMEIPWKIEDLTNIGALEELLPVQVANADLTSIDLPSGVGGGVVLP